MICFGVSNHSPEHALRFLVRRAVVSDESSVAIVPSGTLLGSEKKPSRDILFILSISDLHRNLSVLNSGSYSKVRVFIFASTLRIAELSNTVALDFEPNPANKGLGFILRKELNFLAYKKAVARTSVYAVARQSTRYLTLLTDNAKQGSLLNPLMTFLYTLPSATHQTPVKEAVAAYLYGGKSFASLCSLLDAIRGILVSAGIRGKLRAILQSAEGDNIKAAFRTFRKHKKAGKTISWSAIASEHSVSDYELRYLKSVYDASLGPKTGRRIPTSSVAAKKAAR